MTLANSQAFSSDWKTVSGSNSWQSITPIPTKKELKSSPAYFDPASGGWSTTWAAPSPSLTIQKKKSPITPPSPPVISQDSSVNELIAPFSNLAFTTSWPKSFPTEITKKKPVSIEIPSEQEIPNPTSFIRTSPLPSPVDEEEKLNIEEELSKQSLYKTELCRSFAETGTCRYGHKCQFAHGEHELRTVLRHPKYKTENCKTFVATGTCPYGPRCRFIHPVAASTSPTSSSMARSPSSSPLKKSGDILEEETSRLAIFKNFTS